MDKKTSRELLHNLIQSARRLLPSSFYKADPDPYTDSLHLRRERDAEINERTTPPTDEVIDLCCIWAIEFYTPSNMDALLTGVQRFGWKQDRFHSLRDIEEWVDETGKLSPGVRGGWLNLGFVSSSNSPFHGPSGTNHMTRSQVHPEAKPPNHMTGVGGYLISITSSLVCVLMLFVLDDDYAKKLDTALKTDRQTFYKATPPFRAILDPEQQKIDDIRHIRDEIKRIVTSWFSLNLPGLFSSGLLEGEMPTCELITLRDAEPFSTPRQATPRFLRLLGLEFSYDVWSSTNVPGLKLSLLDMANTSPQYHSILSLKECNLSDKDPKKSMDWSDRGARIDYIDDFLKDGLLPLWAVLLMLEGYGNNLRDIRDSAILRPGSRQNSVTILDKLASNVSFSIDIDAVTSELQSFAQQESWKHQRIPSFVPVGVHRYPEGYTLGESLCSAIAKRASWIQKTDRSLRDHGAQYGSLLGAMENVRLQGQIKNLTITLIVLTIPLTGLTIVLSFESLGLLSFFKPFFESLLSVWIILKALLLP